MQHGSRGVVGGTVPTGTERKGLFFSFFEGIVRRAERTVGDCGHMNTGCSFISFISWQVRKQRVISVLKWLSLFFLLPGTQLIE